MSAKYVIRLMFEWGGAGCLWSGNDETLKAFDVGPIEDRLPLSSSVRNRLVELSSWHDMSLNREYPPAPSLWTSEERDSFEKLADELLNDIRAELGKEFEVVYVPL